jgi:phosphatidylserine/phosphatidylglycerophosphate/cardiolipin synthase-like enzyme
LSKSSIKDGRSLIERQIISLVGRIGAESKYSLSEVMNLILEMAHNKTNEERILVAPSNILDYIPSGKCVDTIQNHLEEIISKAEREILLLTPFWDLPTLKNLLRCTLSRGTKPELVILLVQMDKNSPHLQDIIDSISTYWPEMHVRVFLHTVQSSDQASYPHAKCLIVDRISGYLGSANFTEPGMTGHFELGVSLSSEASMILGELLEYLWSHTEIFNLVWDNNIEYSGAC